MELVRDIFFPYSNRSEHNTYTIIIKVHIGSLRCDLIYVPFIFFASTFVYWSLYMWISYSVRNVILLNLYSTQNIQDLHFHVEFTGVRSLN